MSPEKFNFFYRTNIKSYERFLSTIKLSNKIFAQQEKALNKVYFSPANFLYPKLWVNYSLSSDLYFLNNGLYFESLKMIEYFGISDDNPIPKCDLKAFMLSESISKNAKGRMRHFYDILCRIHNEIQRFKSFKFDCYPESWF